MINPRRQKIVAVTPAVKQAFYLLPEVKYLTVSWATSQIRKLRRERQEQVKLLNTCKEIARKKGNLVYGSLLQNQGFLADLQFILAQEAQEAAMKSVDFAIEPYADNLVLAMYTPGLIQLEFLNQNISALGEYLPEIKVTINTKLLGQPEEYAHVVNYARRMLNYGYTAVGDWATDLWWIYLWKTARLGIKPFGKTYLTKPRRARNVTRTVRVNATTEVTTGTGKYTMPTSNTYITKKITTHYEASPGGKVRHKRISDRRFNTLKAFYWKIMSTRESVMGEGAPYWYLIEHGNAIGGARMSPSNRGGRPDSPSIPPSHFIERAQIKIQDRITYQVAYEINKQTVEIGGVLKTIKTLSQSIIRADYLIGVLKDFLSKRVQTQVFDILVHSRNIMKFMQSITDQEKDRFLQRLNQLALNMLVGDIPPKMRASLGSYSVGRFRVSLKDLQKTIDAALYIQISAGEQAEQDMIETEIETKELLAKAEQLGSGDKRTKKPPV